MPTPSQERPSRPRPRPGAPGPAGDENSILIVVRGPETGRFSANQREFEDAVIQALERQCGAAELWRTPPLYDLAGEDPLWEEIRAAAPRARFCSWLYPRALRLLLAARGVPQSVANAAAAVRFDPACSAAEFAAGLAAAPSAPPRRVRRLDSRVPSPRWYPILDRERCRNCGQCFEFCIFGVYERAVDGTVTVVRPDNCKPGCPACARVCPFGAIVFPRERRDPRIAGAPPAAGPRDSSPAPAARAGAPGAVEDELDGLIRDLDALDL